MNQVTLINFMRFTDEQLDKLRAVSARLDVQQLPNASFEDLPEELRNRVEILYGWGSHFDQAHRFPSLKWIQTHTAGIDYLADNPVWQSQVMLTTLNGVHAVPMAEYGVAMILAFRWRLLSMFQFQARTEWPKGRWDLFAAPELRGSTLGIVGYGAVGRELGRQAQALGMRILAVNFSGKRRQYEGFSEPGLGDPEASIPEKIYPTNHLLDMLPKCDYVVVLAPLTAQTRHLLGVKAFSSMKQTAFLINLARGGLVDETALVEALRQGQIAGAGLDVFEEEPLPPESPLWQIENVIISPHVAGFSPQYDDRASNLFAENLRRYLAGGEMLNLVEKVRGY